MPRGEKSKYTDKQERKADHIADHYEDKGVGAKEAERRAWATVNKDDGGGQKSGSGRGKSTRHPAAHRVAIRAGRLHDRPRQRRPRPPANATLKTDTRMPDDGTNNDKSRDRWVDPNFEHAVRETAYFLWEQDGRPEGREQEYWYQALERTLRERNANAGRKEKPIDASSLVGTRREVDDNQDDLGRPLT